MQLFQLRCFLKTPNWFAHQTLSPLIFCETPMLERKKVPRHLIVLENLLSIVCQTYYRKDMFLSSSKEKDGKKKAEAMAELIAIQRSPSLASKKRGRPCQTKGSNRLKNSETKESRKDEKMSVANLLDSKKNSKSKGGEPPYSARDMLDFLVSPLKTDQELGKLKRKLDNKRNRHFRDRTLPLWKTI